MTFRAIDDVQAINAANASNDELPEVILDRSPAVHGSTEAMIGRKPLAGSSDEAKVRLIDGTNEVAPIKQVAPKAAAMSILQDTMLRSLVAGPSLHAALPACRPRLESA